jgi:hypothetical protein
MNAPPAENTAMVCSESVNAAQKTPAVVPNFQRRRWLKITSFAGRI